jgi:hypothetical protein
VVSKPVARYLARLRDGVKPVTVAKASSTEAKSFGVYLGGFNYPATPAQVRLLSQWNVVVLDSRANGVTEALAACPNASSQILGRVDVRSLVDAHKASNTDPVIQAIQLVEETITTHFKSHNGRNSLFTGVLIANFADHLSPPVFNQVVNYINALGFAVWLEMSTPDYLSNEQCRAINMRAIGGIVYRNGTIRTDGLQQNFHQMAKMRTAMRAVAAQRVPHGPPMMLWETVDEGVQHEYAVTIRTFNWCRFNSALCWIGTAGALVDAESAAVETINDAPLGALMWMKNDTNMKSHNVWRNNDKVSHCQSMQATPSGPLHRHLPF